VGNAGWDFDAVAEDFGGAGGPRSRKPCRCRVPPVRLWPARKPCNCKRAAYRRAALRRWRRWCGQLLDRTEGSLRYDGNPTSRTSGLLNRAKLFPQYRHFFSRPAPRIRLEQALEFATGFLRIGIS
jgi:hypothetical protein